MHMAQIIVRLHNFQIQRVGCNATPLCTAWHCAIPYEPIAVAPELVPGTPEPIPVAPEPIPVAPEPKSEDPESECLHFVTFL